jgi:hypothetical protein
MGDPTGDAFGVEEPSLHHERSRRIVGDKSPSLPIERLSREFERFRSRPSPERSRLIMTAFAANTGVSCSAGPGCAGAGDGDRAKRGDGGRALGDSDRTLSSEPLLDGGDSGSSWTPRFLTETVRLVTEPLAASCARGDTGTGAEGAERRFRCAGV